MSDMMEYKGYHGTVEYSAEDQLLFGSVFGVSDSLNYHGCSVDELQQSFRNCVDDYLDLCAEIGKDPDREFKGSFNVRISPELHRQAVLRATKEGISLNALIQKSLEAYLRPSGSEIYMVSPVPFSVSRVQDDGPFDRFSATAAQL